MLTYYENLNTGINYWPAAKAMYWWQNFDLTEVEQDFARLSACSFKIVRIFLTWEDFQPHPDVVSATALHNLLLTADCAARCSLSLVPTFFCGHMSGINWLPYWMLKTDDNTSRRFPVFSGNAIRNAPVKNFYADSELILAQVEQISRIGRMLKGHPAIHSYDLGNEASNIALPHNREQACNWLGTMVETIKSIDSIPVTLGMHAEDLEEDRHLWPQDAGKFCDYLSMHAYPFYLDWVNDPLDYRLVPFLSIITHWLGKKPVVMQEFGLPTRPFHWQVRTRCEEQRPGCLLFDEAAASLYYARVLAALADNLVPGLAWCYSDYVPSLWNLPPLEMNQHERYFGLFHHDGSPKDQLQAFIPSSWHRFTTGTQCNQGWLQNFNLDDFYASPRRQLTAMFAVYQKFLARGEIS